MPAGQRVELLIGNRRNSVYAVPARYIGHFARQTDAPPRRLTAADRAAAQRAGYLLADAIGGVPVDDVALHDAAELLRRLARESEGEPRFQLEDGRVIGGDEVTFRAVLD